MLVFEFFTRRQLQGVGADHHRRGGQGQGGDSVVEDDPAEVLAGEPPETRSNIQQALSAFEVVELDQRIATAAADLRHRTSLKLMDAYILATAQVNGAILVTRNIRDFPVEMPGIRVPYSL